MKSFPETASSKNLLDILLGPGPEEGRRAKEKAHLGNQDRKRKGPRSGSDRKCESRRWGARDSRTSGSFACLWRAFLETCASWRWSGTFQQGALPHAGEGPPPDSARDRPAGNQICSACLLSLGFSKEPSHRKAQAPEVSAGGSSRARPLHSKLANLPF